MGKRGVCITIMMYLHICSS